MISVIDEIIVDLTAALSAKFETIYKGIVIPIPQSYLPALMVFPISTNIIAKSTAKDQHVYTIGITATISLKKYFDESGTGTTMDAQEAIVKLMEERDTNGKPIDASVLGVLRNNVRGTSYLYNNEIMIEYGKPETNEFPYLQAELNVQAITDLITR